MAKIYNMRIKAVMLACLFALASCTTGQKLTQSTDSTRISYVRDTLYLNTRDSVYIDRYTAGDTVYVTKYAERWRIRDKIVNHTDTITRTETVTETITVADRSGWWRWLLAGLGIGAALIVALKKIPYTKPLMFWL